jgi:hypothetical protein
MGKRFFLKFWVLVINRNDELRIPQGLRPAPFAGPSGTAEAVPFPKTFISGTAAVLPFPKHSSAHG